MSRINTAQIAVLPGTALDMYTLVRRRGLWNSSQREEQQHGSDTEKPLFHPSVGPKSTNEDFPTAPAVLVEFKKGADPARSSLTLVLHLQAAVLLLIH